MQVFKPDGSWVEVYTDESGNEAERPYQHPDLPEYRSPAQIKTAKKKKWPNKLEKERKLAQFVRPCDSAFGFYQAPAAAELVVWLRRAGGSIQRMMNLVESTRYLRRQCLFACLFELKKPENAEHYAEWNRLVELRKETLFTYLESEVMEDLDEGYKESSEEVKIRARGILQTMRLMGVKTLNQVVRKEPKASKNGKDSEPTEEIDKDAMMGEMDELRKRMADDECQEADDNE